MRFLACLIVWLPAVATCDRSAQGQTVHFESDIRPILNRHCTECHGGVKQAADLSLVYKSGIAAVVSEGAPADSELFLRISDPDDDSRMPPAEHGRRLNEKEIGLIQTWIAEGANWQPHWAYGIPRTHQPPPVSDPDWCKSRPDAFILARLDREGLQPAAAADPMRWLRRVSFDLVGLPPSIELRKQFTAKLSAESFDAACEMAVDELLASPGFGERWATVWFDLVRYADSKGLGFDDRRDVWKYRDWVITALNDDLPFDQFTRMQIAGDLFPDPTIEDQLATAVHRLSQTNDEGGTDDEEFRIAAVLDRVNTLWQTWQGTSFSCVQCHNHPYDPFTHEDYYRSVAFFNNSVDSDSPDDWPLLAVPNDSTQYQTASELDRRIRAQSRQLWEHEFAVASDPGLWTAAQKIKGESNVKMAVDKSTDRHVFYATSMLRDDMFIDLYVPLPGQLEKVTALSLNVLPLDPKTALADSEWGFVLTSLKAQLVQLKQGKNLDETSGKSYDVLKDLSVKIVIGDEPFPRYEPALSLDPEAEGGFAAYTRIHHPRRVVFVFDQPLQLSANQRIKLMMRHGTMGSGAHPMVIKRGFIELSDRRELTALASDKKLVELRQKLAALRTQREAIESTHVPVMQSRHGPLGRKSYLFERGLFLTKGQELTPGIPTSILPDDRKIGDRVALADWLVDPDNPLTARVTVNRFWARIFGTGLVASEEDFGSAGDRPSHPELLDDLAIRFQTEHGWSVKQLLRELVLSATYRQSAKKRPEVMEVDPQNRWLAQGPRLPLSAEMVRDQALTISGLKSDRMYGPPVHPPIPDGAWTPFLFDDKWETPEPGDPDRYRRSIYTYVKRSVQYPTQATFDAPTREYCAPRRQRSNTPLQPLATLNDVAFVEITNKFAERIGAHFAEGQSLAPSIEFAFELATCRKPRPAELAAIEQLFTTTREQTDQPTAFKTLASLLLNLDEVLTK